MHFVDAPLAASFPSYLYTDGAVLIKKETKAQSFFLLKAFVGRCLS